MLNGFYDYFFGSEDVNGNNIKVSIENVSVLTNSTELVAFTLPSRTLETKDDDWILLDGQLSSGRSTPVIVPEPDLVAIDDELSTIVSSSVRSLSPVLTLSHSDLSSQKSIIRDYTWNLIRESRNGISGKHVELMRQTKQKAIERKELERKLFENQLLGINDADKKHLNNSSNANSKALNMLNNAAKMKRSTAAGHFATDSKTKPRSKKTNRLLAGRNNDRKVNYLN